MFSMLRDVFRERRQVVVEGWAFPMWKVVRVTRDKKNCMCKARIHDKACYFQRNVRH